MMTDPTMLVLNVPPALEEDVVDYLLEIPAIDGFTSFQAYGHGNHGTMTVAEQVTGRTKRVQFEIIMQEEDVPQITGHLKERFGTHVRYWQMPVYNIGHS